MKRSYRLAIVAVAAVLPFFLGGCSTSTTHAATPRPASPSPLGYSSQPVPWACGPATKATIELCKILRKQRDLGVEVKVRFQLTPQETVFITIADPATGKVTKVEVVDDGNQHWLYGLPGGLTERCLKAIAKADRTGTPDPAAVPLQC